MIVLAIKLHLVWRFPIDFPPVSAGFGPLPSYYTTERLAGTTWVRGACSDQFRGIGAVKISVYICRFCSMVGNCSFDFYGMFNENQLDSMWNYVIYITRMHRDWDLEMKWDIMQSGWCE